MQKQATVYAVCAFFVHAPMKWRRLHIAPVCMQQLTNEVRRSFIIRVMKEIGPSICNGQCECFCIFTCILKQIRGFGENCGGGSMIYGHQELDAADAAESHSHYDERNLICNIILQRLIFKLVLITFGVLPPIFI